jgi:hypothetical protein
VQLPSWLTGQQQPEGQYLKDYTTDLTDLARKNKLDPVIGRHDEINRVIQILSRKVRHDDSSICAAPTCKEGERDIASLSLRVPGISLFALAPSISKD